jgi:hypothetical protein
LGLVDRTLPNFKLKDIKVERSANQLKTETRHRSKERTHKDEDAAASG